MSFVLEDNISETGLIWLEEGNELRGLQHIAKGNGVTPGHEKEFKEKFGIEGREISAFLRDVLLHGKLVSHRIKQGKNRSGHERIYIYKGKRIVFAIGTNGFIVSAYYRKGDKK